MRRVARLGMAAALLWLTSWVAGKSAAAFTVAQDNSREDTRDDRAAADAFEAILPVLRSPRCMNCHSRGDFPRQGEDSHPHTMNVRRGLHGNGMPGARCSSCHQDHNTAGPHTPPGAPGWHLPPPTTPMIWEGLSDRQLCELFKDPRQNGHKNITAIVEHMKTPLVLWGWNPGAGRTPVSMTQSEFLSNVTEWATKGASCPVLVPLRPGACKQANRNAELMKVQSGAIDKMTVCNGDYRSLSA